MAGFVFGISRLLGPTYFNSIFFPLQTLVIKKYYVKLETPSNSTHDHATSYLCFYIKIYTRVTLIDFIYGQVKRVKNPSRTFHDRVVARKHGSYFFLKVKDVKRLKNGKRVFTMSSIFDTVASLVPTMVIVILPTIVDVAGITSTTSSIPRWCIPVITLIIASLTS